MSGEGAGAVGAGNIGADEPPIGKIIEMLVERCAKDPVSWLLGGLLPGLAALVLPLVLLPLLYGVIFLGMLPGLALDDDLATAGGAVAASLVGVLGLVLLLTAVTAPMSASLHRAVWRVLREGGALGPGDALSTWSQDAGRVVLYQILSTAIISVGALFFVVPGILAAAALSFAGPAIYIHRLSIREAIARSVAHFREHWGWHLLLWICSALLHTAVRSIPVVGPMLMFSISPLLALLGYRAWFDSPTASATPSR